MRHPRSGPRGRRCGPAGRVLTAVCCTGLALLPAACTGTAERGPAAGSAAAASSDAGSPASSPAPSTATTAGSATAPAPSAAPTAPRAPASGAAAGSALAGRPVGLAPTGPGVLQAVGPALAAPDLHGRVGVAVVDPRTGRLLYGSGQATSLTPASTLKLFTATAALDRLGAAARFTTKVVRTSPPGAPVSLVLVGGGDVSLARAPVPADGPLASGATAGAADVTTLAARVAAALGPVGQVHLAVDTSLFSGPAASPQWVASYLIGGQVSPVTALTVDAGRVGPGRRQRSLDPALAAEQAFAQALDARGISVVIAPGHVRAPAAAPTVAAVQSPPLATLIGHMLTTSDNDYAESLFRHVAVAAGQPGSFDGGIRAVVADLSRRRVDLHGMRVVDGSGLSRQDRTTPAAMASVLVAALREPALRPIADGLPVAGVSGTVRSGFTGSAAPGRLRVRAKTGTLAGVSALAGTVSTPSAGELVFVFLTDSLPTTYPDGPRSALELAAARLAQCGCHVPGAQPAG